VTQIGAEALILSTFSALFGAEKRKGKALSKSFTIKNLSRNADFWARPRQALWRTVLAHLC
jgi:hypothetical protein